MSSTTRAAAWLRKRPSCEARPCTDDCFRAVQFVEYDVDYDDESNSEAMEDNASDSDYEEVADAATAAAGSDDDAPLRGSHSGAAHAPRAPKVSTGGGAHAGRGSTGGDAGAPRGPRRRKGARALEAGDDADADGAAVLDLIVRSLLQRMDMITELTASRAFLSYGVPAQARHFAGLSCTVLQSWEQQFGTLVNTA